MADIAADTDTAADQWHCRPIRFPTTRSREVNSWEKVIIDGVPFPNRCNRCKRWFRPTAANLDAWSSRIEDSKVASVTCPDCQTPEQTLAANAAVPLEERMLAAYVAANIA
jgi:hypothetical protein